MNTQEKALAAISRRLRTVDDLIKECEEIADKAKVDFYMEVRGTGRSVSYDGTGKDFGDDEGNPTGWDHSQC